MTLTLPDTYPDPDAPFAKKHPALIKHFERTDYQWLKDWQREARVRRCKPVPVVDTHDEQAENVRKLHEPTLTVSSNPPSPDRPTSRKGEWIAGAILFIVFLTAWTLGVYWTKATYGKQEAVSSHAVVQPYVRGQVGK